MQIGREIVVNAPINRVWRRFTETERWPEWWRGIDSVTLVDGWREGSGLVFHSARATNQVGFIAFQKGSYVEWKGRINGGDLTHFWQFTKEDNQVRIRTGHNIRGFAVFSFVPFGRKRLERYLDILLANFKSLVEGDQAETPDAEGAPGEENGEPKPAVARKRARRSAKA